MEHTTTSTVEVIESILSCEGDPKMLTAYRTFYCNECAFLGQMFKMYERRPRRELEDIISKLTAEGGSDDLSLDQLVSAERESDLRLAEREMRSML